MDLFQKTQPKNFIMLIMVISAYTSQAICCAILNADVLIVLAKWKQFCLPGCDVPKRLMNHLW